MAVVSSLRASSPKPTGLEVKVRSDKSLEIRWDSCEATAEVDACFELEIQHFSFAGPMIQPDHSTVMEVNALAAHVPHPERLPKDQAWVVKIGLRVKSEQGSASEAIWKQVTWDDELPEKVSKKDLEERVMDLEKKDLQPFVDAKGVPRFLLVGGQHHGKSSFTNHLYRCLKRDLMLYDQMDVASAGVGEKTVATKSLTVTLDPSQVVFIDTPAFASMNAATMGKLHTLLSTGIKDGTHREALPPAEQSLFSKPPHGAIVVISLCHWRDQPQEMQVYLEKMAEAFKNASGGSVAFPYVVAATHRDSFLQDCQKEDPAKELQNAVEDIKKAALTDHVYTITSYKRESFGSARNNKATGDLLSQLLTKAKLENTGKVQDQTTHNAIIFIIMAVVALVVGLLINKMKSDEALPSEPVS